MVYSVNRSDSCKTMNYPAASYGVSKTARNEASFGEYDPERLNCHTVSCLVRKAALPREKKQTFEFRFHPVA